MFFNLEKQECVNSNKGIFLAAVFDLAINTLWLLRY